MATIARKIEALGGEPASDDYDAVVYTSTYNEAIGHATEIAELADAQIDELIEMVEDMLNGTDLAKWAEYARRTVNGIKHERAR